MQATIIGFAYIEQVLKKPTKVLGGFMRLSDEITGFFVNLGGLRVERKSQVAFDTCDGGTHFMARSANKFGSLAFVGFFGSNITEHHNDAAPKLANWRYRYRGEECFA